MIVLVQKSCLHNDCKRNQSRTKIPILCGRLLQQEAAIFSQSPSTPPGCDVGYGEREFQRHYCQLVVCYCVSSDHAYRNSMELFIPIVHAVRHNHIDNIPSSAKPRLRADANTRETSSKTSTFFTKLVITFEVLNQLNWGARIWKYSFGGLISCINNYCHTCNSHALLKRNMLCKNFVYGKSSKFWRFSCFLSSVKSLAQHILGIPHRIDLGVCSF